jgi:hypothetical protein
MVKPTIYLTGIVSFTYKNWKGETRRRRVRCKQIEYIWVHYLDSYRFTLRAVDLEKGVDRSFLISEINDLKREPDDSL